MRGSAARRVASLLAFAMIYSLFVILGLIREFAAPHDALAGGRPAIHDALVLATPQLALDLGPPGACGTDN